MTNTKLVTLARFTPVMALFSCAAPKAIVVGPPAQADQELAVVEPELSEPDAPSAPDDRIRLPDMMTMPSDDEFRATNPAQVSPNGESGAVIARPPMEPPSRPTGGE